MLDRILGIALILVATLVHPGYLEVITYPDVQLVLGTIVVIYILIGDAIAGLLMGVAVLIMYFQAYAYKMGTSWYEVATAAFVQPRSRTENAVGNYITEEDLTRAQSNVADPMNMSVEIKGIEGVYGEEVYGAQGMDGTMPAYDSALKHAPLSDR